MSRVSRLHRANPMRFNPYYRNAVCRNCGFPGGIKGFKPLRRVAESKLYEHDNTREGIGCDWVGRSRKTLRGWIGKTKDAISSIAGTGEATSSSSPARPK